MRTSRIVSGAAMLLALALAPLAGATTPDVNSAVVMERVFNDCSTSNLQVTNQYPSLIEMMETELTCTEGFANLHLWRLSENSTDAALFSNDSAFRFGFDFQLMGEADSEGGLQVAPWWSNSDGRFQVRTTDGEIAAFGGRLPFYSFTVSQGLTYTKGDIVHLEIEYTPNLLREESPATIEYRVTMNSQEYVSGPLAFDEGNPEEGQGTWGILNNSQVGGHFQVFIGTGVDATARWTDIEFEDLSAPTPVQVTSWGKVKSNFR